MDKSKMMMFIIIALLILLLGTVVGVGVYLISIADSDVNWNEEQAAATTQQIMPSDVRTVALGSRTINLAPGPNFRSDNIITDVVVGLNATVDEDELEEFYTVFTNGIAIARAEVLNVFVTRTYEEVRTLEGRAETAEMVKNRLQEVFGSNLIVQVMFEEWTPVRGQVR